VEAGPEEGSWQAEWLFEREGRSMISKEYLEFNRQLHEKHPEYGVSGSRYVEIVRPFALWGRKAILDYGCGKAILGSNLGPAYKVTNYDPAIDEYSADPDPHPVVVCTDVMEHIEPEFVDDVLKNIRRLALEYAIFAICQKDALKVLPDGRNAHISKHPFPWWEERLTANGFKIFDSFNTEPSCATFRIFCE
jgi:hypothetical protein